MHTEEHIYFSIFELSNSLCEMKTPLESTSTDEILSLSSHLNM